MRQRLVKQQTVTEIESTQDYTAWLNDPRKHKIKEGRVEEPIQANPDSLTEDEAMYHVSNTDKEMQERVQKLLKLAKQTLTEQQYKVFDLVGIQAMTIRKAAKLLKRSPGRIDQLWQVSRKKLQKIYEERT